MTPIFLKLVFAFLMHTLLTSAISPQDYIQLQYGKIPVLSSTSQNTVIRIPCTSFVGSCIFEFTETPRNWNTSPSGQISIRDLNTQIFFISRLVGKVSDSTGYSLDLDLILQSDDGIFRLYDSSQYYSALPFIKKEHTLTTDFSRFISKPSPYPTISDVTKALDSQSNEKIESFLEGILEQQSSCSVKYKYFNELFEVVAQRKKDNLAEIERIGKQIMELENQIFTIYNKQKLAEIAVKQEQTAIDQMEVLELQRLIEESYFEDISNSRIVQKYKQILNKGLYFRNPQQQKMNPHEQDLTLKIKQVQNDLSQYFDLQQELFADTFESFFNQLMENNTDLSNETLIEVQEDYQNMSEAIQYWVKQRQTTMLIQALMSEDDLIQNFEMAIEEKIKEIQKRVEMIEADTETEEGMQLQDINLILEHNLGRINKQRRKLLC